MQNVSKREAVEIVASALRDNGDRKILYLLSGGSSAVIGVKALSGLDEQVRNNITVALVDERFVSYDSTDSNAKLLKDIGILNYTPNFIEVLEAESSSDRAMTAYNYQQKLLQAQKKSEIIIAILGIGSDNHTAGILPGINIDNNNEIIVNYSSDKFERISISPSFFGSIDLLYAYVEGEEKEAAIDKFSEVLDPVDYPSQLIKKAKQYEILYNKEKIE